MFKLYVERPRAIQKPGQSDGVKIQTNDFLPCSQSFNSILCHSRESPVFYPSDSLTVRPLMQRDAQNAPWLGVKKIVAIKNNGALQYGPFVIMQLRQEARLVTPFKMCPEQTRHWQCYSIILRDKSLNCIDAAL